MMPAAYRLLAINAGSSSVKVSLYEHRPTTGQDKPALLLSENLPAKEDPVETLKRFLTHQPKTNDAGQKDGGKGSPSASSSSSSSSSLPSSSTPPIIGVFHRVVHGGSRFYAPTLLDDSNLRELDSLSILDPLHNPPAMTWIKAARAALSSDGSGGDSGGSGKSGRRAVRHIAMFDTTFFHQLPAESRCYALPKRMVDKYEIRRYGFHGLAHDFMYRTIREKLTHLNKAGRLITLQLGSGCSIAAILHGQPIDTSMGFTPLEGLVMSSRCGDVDAGVLTFLAKHESTLCQRDEMERMLYQESGLLALSGGRSKDMKALCESKDPDSQHAVSVFVHRVIKYIGSYVALLGGVDVICFGGGIGEHAPDIRERVIRQLSTYLPIQLDSQANAPKKGPTRRITTQHSQIQVWVVAVDEAELMVSDGLSMVTNSSL